MLCSPGPLHMLFLSMQTLWQVLPHPSRLSTKVISPGSPSCPLPDQDHPSHVVLLGRHQLFRMTQEMPRGLEMQGKGGRRASGIGRVIACESSSCKQEAGSGKIKFIALSHRKLRSQVKLSHRGTNPGIALHSETWLASLCLPQQAHSMQSQCSPWPVKGQERKRDTLLTLSE